MNLQIDFVWAWVCKRVRANECPISFRGCEMVGSTARSEIRRMNEKRYLIFV